MKLEEQTVGVVVPGDQLLESFKGTANAWVKSLIRGRLMAHLPGSHVS